jgi:hypothetical protein
MISPIIGVYRRDALIGFAHAQDFYLCSGWRRKALVSILCQSRRLYGWWSLKVIWIEVLHAASSPSLAL